MLLLWKRLPLHAKAGGVDGHKSAEMGEHA